MRGTVSVAEIQMIHAHVQINDIGNCIYIIVKDYLLSCMSH